MEQVEFGLFDWIDRGNKPLQKLYEERRRLLEVADSAGFLVTILPSTTSPLSPLGRGNG